MANKSFHIVTLKKRTTTRKKSIQIWMNDWEKNSNIATTTKQPNSTLLKSIEY